MVKPKGSNFTDLEIDSILNDLDPFYTGIVQLRLLQTVYHEELQYHKRTTLSRPREIMQDVRALVFPNKRVALQQALASADEEGDGYLQKQQFVKAFLRAKVPMDRDTLEFLFDVMSESYMLPKTDFEPKASGKGEEVQQPKVLNLQFFLEKLFDKHESREVDEIEDTLSNIKASLVYKGLDFSIIFAEEEEVKVELRKAGKKMSREDRAAREREKHEARKKREQSVDMTLNYSRHAQ